MMQSECLSSERLKNVQQQIFNSDSPTKDVSSFEFLYSQAI